jgi:cytochrome c-type biogenesis protein
VTAAPVARAVSAWAFAIAAVAGGVVLAKTGSGVGVFLGVDELVARPAGALDSLGGALPLGYAFAAGMLAAVNPCGFALLPGYLGLYLGESVDAASPARRLGRALGVAGTVSAAFVLTFGAAGLLLTTAGAALGAALPLVGLAVGLGLAAAGAYLLSGGTLASSIGDRAAARLAGAARTPGYRGYAAYGFAYAAASLGCALPIFLTVVGIATAARNPAGGVGQFALYGLGMGLVLTTLTIATALFKGAMLAGARVVGARLLAGLSGALLVLTGAYVVAYWLALGF